MKDLLIFDLDGTLALIEHRRHHVAGPSPDWRAFFAACTDDEPNEPVIQMLRMAVDRGFEVWVWSGRSDEVHAETVIWLHQHGIVYDQLRMRPAGVHKPDEKLKGEWLAELSERDRGRILAIFEDRDRMVKLWRDNGIACFQVAPGDF